MKKSVREFVTAVLGEIKDWGVQLRLIIFNPEYRSIIFSPQYNLIRRSGVFDTDYYLGRNPDLIGIREKPLVHYLMHGMDESRHVSVYFDRHYYLSQMSPDKRDINNPLVHFLQEGWRKGKKPNPLFHTEYYLNRYPAVLRSKRNPLTYYLKKGWRQGHCTSPEMVYLAENTSLSVLIKGKINPLSHFLQRQPYPCFDPTWYLDQVPGLTQFTENYWGHYMKHGAKDGKAPVPLFDPLFYRQNSPDIAVECLDLYSHHQSGRRYEKTRPSEWFDPVFYAEQVPADERIEMTPLEHYLKKGVYEGRYTDERVAVLPEKPVISVIVPVYNVEPHFLNNCIRSVLYQTYPHWELCLADDCSTDPHVRPLLMDWVNEDDRIKVICLEKNSGISGATSRAVELASGEYLAFLDNDDELALDALYHVAEELHRTGAEVIYSDEDLIGDDGSRFSTFYKPDYNPELLLCHNYITHLLVTSADLFARSDGFLKEMDGAQDYDLVLKLSSKASRVHHIARVLYHWRASETSTSINHQQKQYADVAGKRAVDKALEQMKREGEVFQTEWKFYYQPRFQLQTAPLVSIISILQGNTHDGVAWLESLCRQTAYAHLEIVVVLTGDESTLTEAGDKMSAIDSRVRVIFLPECDSRAMLYTRAAMSAKGTYLCFISSNIELCGPGWLDNLLQFAQFEDIGFVGGRIVPNKGDEECLSTAPDINNDSPGYYLQWLADCSQHMNGLHCSQEVMLLTGELCLVRRSHFEKSDGLETDNFPRLFPFADLSMKFRRQSLRNIYAAACEVRRTRSFADQWEPTGNDHKMVDEQAVFQKRWKSVLNAGDPFYNPGCYRDKGISNEQFDHWYSGD